MRGWIRSLGLAVAFSGVWLVPSAFAQAASEVDLALQEGGTASWEIAAMQELKLDAKHEIKLNIRNVADSKGGQVSLQAGEVDVILSDFTWASL